MAQIICLANSIKHNGRCIAGIDISTGLWVRPIGTQQEGAVGNVRLINGCEPQLLDVLEIPIGSKANNLGCQPENVELLPGTWSKISSVPLGEISQYVENTPHLLHNCERGVSLEYFADKPKDKWKSLQLIEIRNARFFRDNYMGNIKRKCSFNYNDAHYTLPVTCPSFDSYVDTTIGCYLTVSLAGPISFDSSPPTCWKMVAGVIPDSTG